MAVAMATVAIVVLTPAKNLNKVFSSGLPFSLKFSRIFLNISEGDMTQKN
jgi:hypothetical protein